VAVNVNGIAP
jgi:hypothetical protein